MQPKPRGPSVPVRPETETATYTLICKCPRTKLKMNMNTFGTNHIIYPCSNNWQNSAFWREKKRMILNITRPLPKKEKPVHNNPPPHPHSHILHPSTPINPPTPTHNQKKKRTRGPVPSQETQKLLPVPKKSANKQINKQKKNTNSDGHYLTSLH